MRNNRQSAFAQTTRMSSQDQTYQTSAPRAPAYDEAYAPDGAVREHWQYLLGSLEELGAEEFNRRRETAERILRDDGATYNDYGAGLVARPWLLDPIPLLIDSAEWSHIESGMRERAELLNLVLRDLYGARTLLRHGVIPAELIYAHPGFLRECQGLQLPGEQQLIQYAADMVRTPDGSIKVMSDRAQTPSGAGYALENRLVMSRVLPSLFRDSHVHRLSLYFNSLRQKLSELNPNGDAGRVAVLTPGNYNETYFEHAFLANFLGYQLVQGGDLTVRDGYLWMKTLNGLSRIDVLLRRVDDIYCDPVELKSDSQLGVPGLLEAMRLGNVAVVNPPGSGVLENRGLARFLPAAARHFLGRDLRLDSARSYWCGDPSDRAFVLDNLPDLVIKSCFRDPTLPSVLGSSLGEKETRELRAAIDARPRDYVAQEFLQPSGSPVWNDGEHISLPCVLRGFAVAGESSYTIMPGGLTRVGRQPGMFEISNRLGSLSKDTWILASEPERQAAPEPAAPAGAAEFRAGGMQLPSRVIENLFWVGRYMERAEASLRLLRTVFTLLHGEEPIATESRSLLLRAVTHLTCTYPGFLDEEAPLAAPEQELLAVVIDGERAGSVLYSLRGMLDAVSQVKDYMSADTQRILNDLEDARASLPGKLVQGFHSAPEEELGSLVTTLLALSGLAKESMMRGQGWHFMDMGRRIERGLQTVSLLRSLWVPVLSGEEEYLVLEAVLLSTDSLMTYRRNYLGDLNIVNALDLLLLEPANPRALAFQVDRVSEALATLRPGDSRRPSSEEQFVLEASTRLRLADTGLLAGAADGAFLRGELDQLLARVAHLLGQAAETLNDRYFDHTAGPHPMTPREPGPEPES